MSDSVDHRKLAAETMRGPGLPGLTQKFTIHGTDPETHEPHPYDFYLKLAWFGERLDYIDITCSGAQAHNIRALMEMTCKETYALLRDGSWTTEKLIREWRGNQFEPAGYCPQLDGLVKSPIDAAGRLIERLRYRWEGR